MSIYLEMFSWYQSIRRSGPISSTFILIASAQTIQKKAFTKFSWVSISQVVPEDALIKSLGGEIKTESENRFQKSEVSTME